MEEYVLQDTAKFAEIPEGNFLNENGNSHESHQLFLSPFAMADNLTPLEERAVKQRISQRLAAVYSLEKLRKVVQRLRESITLGNNFIDELYGDEEKKKAKRVAVKKEKAEFDNNE